MLRMLTQQNPDNRWIDARTAACYMFECNDPSSHQINRAEAYMDRLGPTTCYAPNNAGLLEEKRVERALDNGGLKWCYQYRLINDSNNHKVHISNH